MQARRGHEHSSESEARSGVDWSGYGRLLAMVGVSTIVMYFFYWNIYRFEDFRLSETRAFMSLLMGGTMLAFMLLLYKRGGRSRHGARDGACTPCRLPRGVPLRGGERRGGAGGQPLIRRPTIPVRR